jgi:predicted ArsR family transcriptional regulator
MAQDQVTEVGMRPRASIRLRVCNVLVSGRAMTADEVAEALGESVLSVRPRISELAKLGILRQSGAWGCTATGSPAAKWVLA